MLTLIRRFLQSQLGVGIALVLFGVIAVSFALGNVSTSGGLGGLLSGDAAVTVGHSRLGSADLSRAVDRVFAEARGQDERLTMQGFIAQGGFEAAVNQAIDQAAITDFGKANGIVAGKRLVDSELTKIPSLQGPDGRFSDKLYQQLLAQKQLSDAEVRRQISAALIARQTLLPAQYGAEVPAESVRRYAAMLKEKRIGAAALVPAAAFLPKAPPSDAELASFYASHRAAFMRPERRVIRYALFDASALKHIPAPSEAEIAAAYHANAGQYAASENRKVTLLILPDEASARAALATGSLTAAAKAKGLATSTLGPLTRDALAQQSAPEVAAAAFIAHAGAVAGPIKSALGYYVLHVDAIDNKPARGLAEVRGEIAAALLAKKRQSALADLTARLDDQFEKGGALSDAAQELGVGISQTDPLLANGQVFAKPGQTAPKAIARILPTAFTMEREHAAQLADIGDDKHPTDGQHFAIFDVASITPAAPAPFAEIKRAVATAWALDQGNAAARAAALKALGAVQHGADLAKALAGLGVALPPVQPLAMGREDLAKFRGQVPPMLSTFFGMAAGTAKLISAGERGWVIVQLRQVIPGAVPTNDPILADAGRQLGKLAGEEYSEELRTAIRRAVGVSRNEAAIAALRKQLGGG